jgi:TRAP-type mannitol/chloroaromatic compound transport system permease small subunit
MRAITRPIEWVSEICGGAAALCALGLIVVTMIEVTSRYVLRMPTLWAFDVAYMLNGGGFMLGCALALKYNQHVSVDILSQRFSPRLRRAIEIVVFTALLLPAVGFLCYAAWGQFLKAWVTGEIEQVSPWQPVVWPFRLMMAVGLSALWLQILARILAGPPKESPDIAHG